MINATLGFIFTPNFDQVLLIKKQRPESHRNKLNGLGGKCERGESFVQCLSREVKEEAGLSIAETAWTKVGVMTWTEWHVEIFATIYDGSPEDINRSEPIDWYSTTHLPPNIVTNLAWLIPLARDVLEQDNHVLDVVIRYQST